MDLEFAAGEEIERRSLAIIEEEIGEHGFSSMEWGVVRRMVHASADFSILPLIKFNADPISKGIEAFKRGAPIITDSNMIKSGISVARLEEINPGYKRQSILCRVAILLGRS